MGSFKHTEEPYCFDNTEDMICLQVSILPKKKETASSIRAQVVPPWHTAGSK